MSNSLKSSRYASENLEAIENLRNNYVLKHRGIIEGPWRSVFEELSKCGGSCQGIVDGKLICYQYDGQGMSQQFPEEGEFYGTIFVRCLDENKLPLYINSPGKQVREAVANRLKGDRAFSPIPVRQDIVDSYNYLSRRNQRIQAVIGYCDYVIRHHFKELLNKIEKKYMYDSPVLTLTINSRVYLFKGDKFLLCPETRNWIFSVEDLGTDDMVSVQDTYKKKLDVTILEEQHE